MQGIHEVRGKFSFMAIHPAALQETAIKLRNGEWDVYEYVEEVCDRVENTDPDIRALVAEPNRRDRLVSSAKTLQDQFPDQDNYPPLYGIPVGVKDIIHVDGLTTRAGTALPPELFAGPEASVVKTLRDTGAHVLGKTVTTEFAGSGPGLTRNPHDLQHTPGGSSSGSAAAVAAGMTPLALGTQTGGSVIRPAAFCGIVGFKPSLDRIPTDGVIPRSKTIDHIGLFTQGIQGMQLAASVVCEEWGQGETNRQPVLGVPQGPYLDKASEEALKAFQDQIETLEGSGYEIRCIQIFQDFETVDRWHKHLTMAELALVHNEWFDEYRAFYRTSMANRIREGQSVSTKELANARAGCQIVREELHGIMEAENVDVWICPAAPSPAPEGITTTGDSVMNCPWTYSGLPAVTIPAGSIDGLPVGLQCVARFGADEQLMTWAKLFEEVLSYDGQQ